MVPTTSIRILPVTARPMVRFWVLSVDFVVVVAWFSSMGPECVELESFSRSEAGLLFVEFLFAEVAVGLVDADSVGSVLMDWVEDSDELVVVDEGGAVSVASGLGLGAGS